MSHVFVGGAQRSGTTLLATLLCAGPETNEYLGECGGLRSLLETFKFMRGRFPDEGINYFQSLPALDSYFRSTLESFFTLVLATQAPARRLVMKEPHMTLFFPHIYHLFPDSRFVLIKRDPRDVVVSMLKVGERMAAKGHSHLFNAGNVAEIAKNIRGFYQPVFGAADRNPAFAARCTWVQYETLVTNPEEVLAQVRNGTGLSLEGVDPHNPGKHKGKADAGLESMDRLKPWVTDIQASGSLSNQAVGRYREHLDAEQLLEVEKATAFLIKKFGYEFENEEAAALAE
ncbi:sulfotransferase family protein [Kordiimonas marina]|uniref:sulfotransferase family protein n=1 Tax=Kordiimonas marina TaxID=2872312 RepID=UPI001FF65F83|nr:sulfotransferase [Kordiimonas marina]MCJ9430776.1 sulfotransferase [Kordiimonas marina]